MGIGVRIKREVGDKMERSKLFQTTFYVVAFATGSLML